MFLLLCVFWPFGFVFCCVFCCVFWAFRDAVFWAFGCPPLFDPEDPDDPLRKILLIIEEVVVFLIIYFLLCAMVTWILYALCFLGGYLARDFQYFGYDLMFLFLKPRIASIVDAAKEDVESVKNMIRLLQRLPRATKGSQFLEISRDPLLTLKYVEHIDAEYFVHGDEGQLVLLRAIVQLSWRLFVYLHINPSVMTRSEAMTLGRCVWELRRTRRRKGIPNAPPVEKMDT